MSYYLTIAIFSAITMIGVLGAFILTGQTGLFSLGQAAFMGLGAYISAIAFTRYNLPFAVSAVAAIAIAVSVAFLVGFATLNIRQDFFVLATFGFGQAVLAILNESVKVTGGATGYAGVPRLTTPWLAFGSLIVAIFLVWNFRRSLYGRVSLAVRSDQLAAGVAGINVFRHKLLVFMLASAFAAYAGVLLGFFTTYVEPAMFGWMQDVFWIIMIFFGGRDSLTGTLVGAATLSALPEALRFTSEWRITAYCIIILLIINFRPRGLFGTWELSLRPLLAQRRPSRSLIAQQQEQNVRAGDRQ